MKMLSLFSGIGGIDLAAQWAGIETVAFCEKDKFCQKVLAKHWPNVPCFDDVKTLTKEAVENAGIGRIDIVAGGFPCQPFSVAGKRRGAADDRHLWPEMLRVIKEIRPAWVIGENVPGLISMGLEQVLIDLENEGYEAQPFIIPACAVNAPHKRNRVFIVAHASIEREGRSFETAIDLDGSGENVPDADGINGNDTGYGTGKISQLEATEIFKSIPNADEQRLQRHGRLCECTDKWLTWKGRRPFQNIWEFEPEVGRLAHGVPARVAKLKALGNAVVPQQIYPIFKAIMEVENVWTQ